MPEESAHKILIPEPETGRVLHLTMQSARLYLLDFTLETSTIEQEGRDVRVLCENGGSIVLHDFFSAIAQEDITLELRDGTLISGQDLAEVLAVCLKDFHTKGHLPLTAMAVDAADLAGEGKNASASLSLTDVLDASPPSLFALLPSETARGGQDFAAGSGSLVAINSIDLSAGASMSDECLASALLLLQRMDT